MQTTINQQIADLIKGPPIGSREWLSCIPPAQLVAAQLLVANRVPVVVQQRTDASSPSFSVVFDGTEFVAGSFEDHAAATHFAESWNKTQKA